MTTLNSLDVSSTPIVHIGGLPKNLQVFDIDNCAQVKEIPNLSQLGRLQNLNVSGCKQVEEIHGVDQLQNIILLMCNGTSIKHLPDLSMLTTLQLLWMSSTPILYIVGLLKKLRIFVMQHSAQVKELPNLSQLNRLPRSYLCSCKQVEEMHGVDKRQNLNYLDCSGMSEDWIPRCKILIQTNRFAHLSMKGVQNIKGTKGTSE